VTAALVLVALAAAASATPDAGVDGATGGATAAVVARSSAAASAALPVGAAPSTSAPPPIPSSPAAKAAARVAHAQALARLRAGRADEAVALFARAAAGDPGNAMFATDLGFALGKVGRRAEAEAVLRDAIAKDPRRVYAYVNLADLLADDPARWERRDAIVALLDKGLGALKEDRKGRFNLLLRVANFERAVGRTAAARARIEPLLADAQEGALTPAQRKRVLDQLDAITLDERAHALEPWPAPAVTAAERGLADDAARALGAGRDDEARATAEALIRAHASWERARVLRGRALEAVGRVDEAARELEIAVNLAPSDAEAWRALGRLLALHGGALEADRADEALRNALALEPAWADLRALRAELAHRRAGLASPPSAPHGTGPSEHARALFEEAEEWIDVGDPAGLGRDLLDQALADSPGYVAAAITGYSLEGKVSDASVTALWDDGAALWALVTGVRSVAGARGPEGAPGAQPATEPVLGPALEKDRAVDALTRPWVDRAVALDVQEARFSRALARAAAGDRTGALDDLVAYVAREPEPAHLAEARALRAGLAGGEGRPSPERLARIRLLEDRPDAALRALGGTCAVGLPADRLLALGLVFESTDRLGEARVCYERAAGPVGDDAASTRLARLDARLPDADLAAAAPAPLARAATHGSAAAEWALARREAARGDGAAALEGADRALALADARADDADVWVPAARAARAGWAAAGVERARAARARRRGLVAAALAAVALALAWSLRRRFGGWTLAGALARRPALYPEVARAVGELRHDVLKHRAGVIGLVAEPDAGARRGDLARALLEPTPASEVVASAHARLAHAARGQGLALRPLAREPALGPLAADLARAERLLAAPPPAPLDVARLLAIDARLRGAHAARLAALLQLGPRSRLGPSELPAWIAAVEASARGAGARWIAPALLFGELDVEFPVERDALGAIFTNLLRNAEAAAGAREGGAVIVRVERERDVTGQRLASLYVGDSAPSTLTLEAVEAREGGRGLAIVRDLVRQWRGHLVIRAEAAPFTKVVGACFPL
jgi:tetratricopeptide (TPR) repeat protein